MKHNRFIILGVTFLSLITACGNNNEPTPKPEPEPPTEGEDPSIPETPELPETIQLFEDTSFETGFHLKSTTTNDGSKIVKYLDYEGKAKKSDRQVWNMAQRWTPFNFKDAPYSYVDGKHIYENESRKLVVDSANNQMSMTLDSWAEYLELFRGSRTKTSQNWSHFLLEQDFRTAVPLKDLEALNLSFDFKIDEMIMCDEANYNPNIHAAQFIMYFTIRNNVTNKFFWFGVPLYDNRGGIYNPGYNIDQGFVGATNTLIYRMGTKDYIEDREVQVGKEYKINIDLLQEIQNAFVFGSQEESINKPFKDWKYEDLSIGYMNFGWELPGSFKVRSTFKDLSLVGDYA